MRAISNGDIGCFAFCRREANTERTLAPKVIKITHQMANAVHALSGAVLLLERDFEKQREGLDELSRELFAMLKDQCRQVELHLEELRRIAVQYREDPEGGTNPKRQG